MLQEKKQRRGENKGENGEGNTDNELMIEENIPH